MKQVLVCVDGSQYAKSCCDHAAWICKGTDVRLEIVYVTDLRQFEVPFVADLSGSLGIQPFQAVVAQLQEIEEKKVQIILDEAEKTIRAAGFSGEIKRTHKTGFLVDSFRELEENADLVVLGKRGENANFATEHLGSTMERVVRSSSIPCFVASRAFREIKKVMIAYQDVPSCHKALAFMKEFPQFREVEVHLVTVAVSEEESSALETLKSAETSLNDAGFKPICQMLHGIPTDALEQYVSGTEVDMLLMGAYGHSRLRHLFLGSSTQELLRGCHIPTLLFR